MYYGPPEEQFWRTILIWTEVPYSYGGIYVPYMDGQKLCVFFFLEKPHITDSESYNFSLLVLEIYYGLKSTTDSL